MFKNKENVLNHQKELLDGQVLVSEDGEIWRWDGYTSKGKENASIKTVLTCHIQCVQTQNNRNEYKKNSNTDIHT